MIERILGFIALGSMLVGCGARVSESPSESNTNWLQSCDADADCSSDLACNCGVCTLNCQDVACPGSLECLGTCGGSVPSCQAQCSTDDDCAYLDGSAECREGVCAIANKGLSANRIKKAEPPPPEPLIDEAQFKAATVSRSEVLLKDDTGAAFRVIEVPAASNAPVIVESPLGWVASSWRNIGDGRAPQGYESVVYHSADGMHWEQLPVDPGHDDLRISGMAYGAGRYVLVGTRLGGRAFVMTSTDGENWTETEQTLEIPNAWGSVAFAGEFFFAFGFQYLGVSRDGVDWSLVPITTVQITDVAYGDGRYLLVGSGPMQTSTDGLTWEAHDVDCSLPGACIMTPASPSIDGTPGEPGQVIQSIQYHALFAEGRFFSDQLSSADGVTWEAVPERYPVAYVDGHFLGAVNLSQGIDTWTMGGNVETLRVVRAGKDAVTAAGRDLGSVGVLDQDVPMPQTMDLSFDDGLTCETAACVNIDGRLVLVPPPGTAPLEDKSPRDANGAPLLSDECPVSSMIFCDDYDARSGCVCEPEAPRNPDYCEDVGMYQCEGAFSQRDDEWELEEVREGGCDCEYADPNAPPGLGVNCEREEVVCDAALQCLPIDPPPSNGGPPYQPQVCTVPCETDADCPSWEATGFCAGSVQLRCSAGSCQPRDCE